LNQITTYLTKSLKSTNMRDAKRCGMVLGGIALLIKACDTYSCHVMENDYDLSFGIGKFVKLDLKKREDIQHDEVIDVVPNSNNVNNLH